MSAFLISTNQLLPLDNNILFSANKFPDIKLRRVFMVQSLSNCK